MYTSNKTGPKIVLCVTSKVTWDNDDFISFHLPVFISTSLIDNFVKDHLAFYKIDFYEKLSDWIFFTSVQWSVVRSTLEKSTITARTTSPLPMGLIMSSFQCNSRVILLKTWHGFLIHEQHGAIINVIQQFVCTKVFVNFW